MTGDHAFGALLRRHREGAGLSQEALAERAGLTANAISALERGERRRPYPHTVGALAEALGLAPGERAALAAAVPPRGRAVAQPGSAGATAPEGASGWSPGDAAELLHTKLIAPPVPAGLIDRPRLLERLATGRRGKLTLVAAPAGSGKTTLLRASLPGYGAVAWVALDAGDNDPARFWGHVAAALEGACPGIGAPAMGLLRTPAAAPIEAVLVAVLNRVSAQHGDVTLILDDYHAIASPPIHAALAFLLDHAPPRLHLVIASRTDPPLPLARLRARGELAEIRAADLRFSADETAAFLRAALAAPLPDGSAATLAARTEGWIAGLQLAALALRDHPDPGAAIAAFGGSNRFVVDYLAEEVLARQPAPVRAFLLRTAILERLAAPLCDAVTGGEDGAALLERLEREQLFLLPLDDARRWYRFHGLFATVLRHHLERELPADAVAALHARAATWLVAAGRSDEALAHARAAGDPDLVMALVESLGPAALARGEHQTVRGWLDALDLAQIMARPALALLAAWAAQQRGEVAAILPWVAAAERGGAAAGRAGEIAALRAFALILTDPPAGIAAARRALATLPPDARRLRDRVALNLAMAHRLAGRPAEAAAALDTVALDAPDIERATLVQWHTLLAEVRQLQGHFPAAIALLERALALATDADGRSLPLPIAARAAIVLGELLYLRGDLDGAERHLRAAIAGGRGWASSNFIWPAHVVLAATLAARGDAPGAEAAVVAAELLARQSGQPAALALVADWAVRVRLALGTDPGAPPARRLDSEDRPVGLPTMLREFGRVTRAWRLLAAGQPDEAIALLEPLLRRAEGDGRGGDIIERAALLAVARVGRGDEAGALDLLDRALAHAAPAGAVRPFIDLGAPMIALLRRARTGGSGAAAGGAQGAFVDRLLAGAPPQEAVDMSPDRSAPDERGVGDALTDREGEVLRLMAAGLSNAEIAVRLFIGTGTVKTHVNRLFAKLGATSRTAAVARARALGLLAE